MCATKRVETIYFTSFRWYIYMFIKKNDRISRYYERGWLKKQSFKEFLMTIPAWNFPVLWNLKECYWSLIAFSSTKDSASFLTPFNQVNCFHKGPFSLFDPVLTVTTLLKYCKCYSYKQIAWQWKLNSRNQCHQPTFSLSMLNNIIHCSSV